MANAGGSDDGFEERVHEFVVGNNPVPEVVLARARAAGHTRAPENSELLDLVYDSIVDRRLLDVRIDECVRLLTFAGGGLHLEIRLDTTFGERRFSGWAAPVRVADAQLRTENDTRDLKVEPDGTIAARVRVRVPSSVLLNVDVHGKLFKFHTSWFSP